MRLNRPDPHDEMIDGLVNSRRFLRDLEITPAPSKFTPAPGSVGYRSHRYDWVMFLISIVTAFCWLGMGIVIGKYLI